MFESEHKLRHVAFFDEIASRTDGEPEFHAAVAGLVVLRLVDAWLDEGPVVTNDDAFTVRNVEAAIEQMSEGSTARTLLARVLDALREAKPDIHVVVTPLMAYAQALEYEAKWTLAVDVYHSVLAHLHPLQDNDASVAAQLRLGSCYRALNRIPEATAAYAAASEIATATGDFVGILRARVGEGAIAVLKGNLPLAQDILDDTIVRARGDQLKDVRSRALHERATVAKYRGQYELAIKFAYDALHSSQSPAEKDRILADIAGAFSDMGVFSAATDAYLILSLTAVEQYTRWGATLNLLHIAMQTGSQILFEQHRRQLVGVPLPPFFATGFELTLGQGYQKFGDDDRARRHLERTIALAKEHDFNQLLFDAEDALYDIRKPAPTRREPAELPLDVREVATAIRQMRESVGV